MKLAKYIAASVIVVLIAIAILIRVPQVQDRLIEGLAEDAINNPTILPEDSLTAVVCGSRSPFPTPGRAETCILIKAGENYFVVDSGDGSVANLRNWRIPINNVRVLLTHLHSDHISDLNDLHQHTWVAQSRAKKLDVYGPKGVENVTRGFEEAFKADYQFRNEHHGDELAPLDVAGFDPHPIDLSNPVIINEGDLKVTAFEVSHEPVEPALGYRFDYKGRSIVISGDTRYSENIIKAANEADVLFHEAQANHILKILEDMSNRLGMPLRAKIFKDILSYHTTPEEAAKIANLAKVDHLVFYHLVPAPINAIASRIFLRGVNDIRQEWTISKDGTTVSLPIDSNAIIISKIN